jgi:hypothetical protein
LSEAFDPREFVGRAPPLLDRENERKRLAFACFVEAHGLLDAVILDDEVFGLQSVHNCPPRIFDQSGE